MFAGHTTPLALAYFVGLGGWLLAARMLPEMWPPETASPFPRPWKELGIALAGGVGVILVGQLWSTGIRLPEDGAAGPLLGTVNQARSRDVTWFWLLHFCMDMTQFARVTGVR